MQQQLDIIVTSLTSFWTQMAGFVPQLIAALVLLFVGWIVARVVRSGIVKLLNLLHFDDLAQKSGIEAFLKEGDLDVSLSRLIASLVYWLLILVVIVMVSNSLGLHVVADLFNRIVLYIPNIVVAILVLVFGAVLSRFINRVIFAYLNNIGIQGALTISTISEYAILVFVFFIALEQLQIASELITAAFSIAFGAFALAFAIAFGLGGKEWAAGLIARMHDKNGLK
jgi:Mechanosensitive ion channel, conserved TM helix